MISAQNQVFHIVERNPDENKNVVISDVVSQEIGYEIMKAFT